MDMKINIIKYETMGRKHLLQELSGIKVQGPIHQTMIKNGKKVDSFAVFAKIILYITIFFKNVFKGKVKKKYRQKAFQTLE